MLESLFNKVEPKVYNFIKWRLQYSCFHVKFAKFLRTLILKNICVQLPLDCTTPLNCSLLTLTACRNWTIFRVVITKINASKRSMFFKINAHAKNKLLIYWLQIICKTLTNFVKERYQALYNVQKYVFFIIHRGVLSPNYENQISKRMCKDKEIILTLGWW